MKSLTYGNVTFPPTIKEYDLPDNIFDYDSYNYWHPCPNNKNGTNNEGVGRKKNSL